MFRIGTAVIAATLVLAGCDNGGGAPVRLSFGMENSAPCDSLEIFVDLDQAGASLASLGDGSPDCVLDAVLAGQGCEVEFLASNDGNELRIELTDCEVTEATLFQCGFRNVDVNALNAAVHASCECANEPNCPLNGSTCYRSPGICVTENPSGHGCENCLNHIDDDGDGEVDCDDGNCFLECGVGLTTVTCSSSTTVTSEPTTTSLGVAATAE